MFPSDKAVAGYEKQDVLWQDGQTVGILSKPFPLPHFIDNIIIIIMNHCCENLRLFPACIPH